MQAARHARQAFGQDPDAPYMPHLSLLYSDIPSETRWMHVKRLLAWASHLCLHLIPQLSRDSCCVCCRADLALREQQCLLGGGSNGLPVTGFDVDSISLWYTIGDDKCLKSWRLVKHFPLT